MTYAGTGGLIALDTNLLVYAHRRDSAWHEDAAARVRALAEGSANWAIPWPCIHEFLGLVTHPRIYAPPTPLTKALAQVSAWLESPTLVLLAEGEGYGSVFAVARALQGRGSPDTGRTHRGPVHPPWGA